MFALGARRPHWRRTRVVYLGPVSPAQGTALLIYAFIVVVIGGFGSIGGTAMAALLVGLVQQLANYYLSSGHW